MVEQRPLSSATAERRVETVFDHTGNPVEADTMITATRTDTTTTEWYADGMRRQESTTVTGHNAGDVTWRWGYDPAGNTTHTWSPSAVAGAANNTAGEPTVMAYSPDGLVTEMVEPVLADGSQHRETSFSHDPLGRVTLEEVGLVGASPASSPAKSYAWTTLGQPKTETGRDGTVQSFTYNAAGQLTAASENAHGASLGAGYYLNGWLRDTETAQPNTPVRYQNFKYYGDGLEAWRTFGQDPTFAQVENIQAYVYNDARAMTAASAAGWTFGFDPWNVSYDRAGRAITMTDPPNGAAPARTTTLDRNPDGTVADRTLHSGAAGSSVIDEWTYTYDATGRVGSRDRSGAGSVSEVFGYDEAGGLATINAGQVSYDPNGNRLSGPGMPTLSFRADNSIATGPGPNGTGTEAYQYTPWGGLTRDACRTYSYDGFDRAQTTELRQNLELLPRCEILDNLLRANDHKRYDPLGRNIWARQDRLNLAGIPVNTQYLHLHHVGLDQDLLYEQVVGVANRSGRYVNTPGGTPLAVIDNNNDREFLHRDGQGDTVLAINDAGVEQCAPEMDQWGQSDTDCDNPVLPASPNRKWYNSSRLDTATDTYQWGSRTYNPTTATWQQPDTSVGSGAPSQVSIGSDPLVANRYSYVNGDPINHADPTGHILEECASGEFVCGPNSQGAVVPDVEATVVRDVERYGDFSSEVGGISVSEIAAMLATGSTFSAQEVLKRLASTSEKNAVRLLEHAEFLLSIERNIPGWQSIGSYLRTLKRLRIDKGVRDAIGMAGEDFRNTLKRASLRGQRSATMSARSLALSNARFLRTTGRALGLLGVGLEIYGGWQAVQEAETRGEVLEAAGETGGRIGGGLAAGTGVLVGCAAVTGGSCGLAVLIVAGGISIVGSEAGEEVGGALGRLLEDAISHLESKPQLWSWDYVARSLRPG